MLLGTVAAGDDPAEQRVADRQAMTVAELCDEYLAKAKAGQVLTRRGKAKRRPPSRPMQVGSSGTSSHCSVNPNRLANIGIGHAAVDGGFGYTYLDPSKGHEFSARPCAPGGYALSSTAGILCVWNPRSYIA